MSSDRDFGIHCISCMCLSCLCVCVSADCLQVLLEAGADPNSVGPALSTPVILAAAEGHHK